MSVHWERVDGVPKAYLEEMDKKALLALRTYHNRGFDGTPQPPLDGYDLEDEEEIEEAPKAAAPAVPDGLLGQVISSIHAFSQGSTERATLARQIWLVLLEGDHGVRNAVEALGTVQGAVCYAKGRTRRAIATGAIRLEPTQECFEAIVREMGAAGSEALRWRRADLLNMAAAAFELDPIDLRSKRRTKDLVLPRQVAMWLCKKFTLSSYPEIASTFGGKDHTTVLHAARKIGAFVEDYALDGGEDPEKWLDLFRANSAALRAYSIDKRARHDDLAKITPSR